MSSVLVPVAAGLKGYKIRRSCPERTERGFQSWGAGKYRLLIHEQTAQSDTHPMVQQSKRKIW